MLNGILQAPLDRRTIMRVAAGLVPGVAIGTSLGRPTPALAKSETFDPRSPRDNLEAYIRITRSIDPAETTVGWYGGRVFSVIGDFEIVRPLFDFEGFGVGRSDKLGDDSYRILWKEVGYYKDLASGKILETWTNPLNGRTVEVYPVNNDPVNAHLKTDLRIGFGATSDEHAETMKFLLPWRFMGPNALTSFDVNLQWKSPLDPKVWKRESPGERVRVSEYQQFRVNTDQLRDRSIPSLDRYASWNRIAAWLPWMEMSQAPGHLFYRTQTLKLRRVEDLPPDILAYTQKRFPRYLERPTDWVEPNVSSFEVFARDRKPRP